MTTTFTDTRALVSAQWLEDHLDDPTVRIVEVDVSPVAHREGHIPGAVLWDIYSDLKDDHYQPRPTPDLEELVRDSGIDSDSIVVFYGYAPAMGFWLMRHLGHPELRILDIDRAAWQRQQRPWTSAPATPRRGNYRLGDKVEYARASQVDVQAAIDDERQTILDARSALEYEGERFWPSGGSLEGGRAGHIPSSIHLPADGLTGPDGAFLPPAELARVFAAVQRSKAQITTYCTVGARASTVWFVLTELLGHDNVRVYDGSWAQWGTDPALPVT